ncbi:SDR family NAD(P)-dependent oxidoreductase [Roseomonas marmotae]|uniref:SDR family oxidoreductase n=1 Tax=Roseomonas marmotae TaxID=2768161 RepID=A0ABS3KB04_9PROT|nr:SDR family oxidoreductase [Roseomonas marmotae]MBO1074650.1 SDR family oxidoreductase [Roseomonas marmotae]QTI81670.1 SDR family oxidoreductase [Roseomonas marmotae]
MSMLAGQVALVLGGSRGIGRSTVEQLALAGARVGIASRDRAACEAVAADIAGRGGEALALGVDVADFASVEAAVGAVLERFGRLDILVNNAGVIEPIGRVDEVDPAAWARSITINLIGAYNGCRAALPAMTARGGGVVVNVSSGAAARPNEGWSAYCAGKAGLAMLTRSIHLECAELGIRCYGFRPGVVDTEMQVAIRASGINEISRLDRSQLAPPEEPARAIAWLCGEEARDLAGEELTVRDAVLRQRVGLPPV